MADFREHVTRAWCRLWSRFWPWLGITALATSQPLAISVGRNFEYEYWLMATGLFGLGSIMLAGFSSPIAEESNPAAAIARALALPVVALAFAALWRQILSCPCAAGEFFVWWLWQFAPSALAFTALAGLLRAWRQQTGLGRGLTALAGLLLALAPLVLLWVFPQKRLIGFFIGYIHGPIYDRLIPFTEDQQLVRLGQALIAAALIALTASRRFGLKGLSAAFGLGLMLSFTLSAITSSTGHGHAALHRQLSAAIERDGLTLWYAPGSLTEERAQELADEAAFHVEDLSRELALSPDRPKVAVYVYPDRRAKKAWFGGLTTDITDVVSPSIHITADSFPHGTLRHELVHALASGVGFYGLGFHPNMALTEGLAVYHAPRPSRYDLHTEAATITKKFWQSDVAGLFGPKFWAYSGARAYLVAGSMLQYLTDTYGSAAVLKLYGGASFSAAFGKSRDQVVADWLTLLERRYDPALDDVLSRRYAYGGVLADTCPHSKASFYEAEREDSSWWSLRAGDWRPPPRSPSHPQLQLIPVAELTAERLSQLATGIEAELSRDIPPGLRLRLLLRLASTRALLSGQPAEAIEPAEALEQAEALPGVKPPGLARLMALLKLLAGDDSAAAKAVHRFLLSGDTSALTPDKKGDEGAKSPNAAHFAQGYLRLRNTRTNTCAAAKLPPGQPYVLVRAFYRLQLSCLLRTDRARAPALLAAWQKAAPKGSEDARALAIDAALLAAMAAGSR